MTAPAVVGEVAVLAAGWRSIGLRAAAVEWELDRPVRLRGSLAARLRGALGPALAEIGARAGTLASIPGDRRPPALWFGGWSCPAGPVRRVRAELRCVGAVGADWPALRGALSRLRLPAAGHHGGLADTLRCTVAWRGGVSGVGFGPALDGDGVLETPGGACLVETVTPLHLTAAGRMVDGPPPLPVLVRSAGERLHQLCLHWGEGGEALPSVVARAYRESLDGRLVWAEMAQPVSVSRRSSRTGQTQVIRGVRGTFAYSGVSALALAVLSLGAEAGVGKDTAFGCGQVRISIAEER